MDKSSFIRQHGISSIRIDSDELTQICHDLRSPLNSILGYAQLLAQADQDPDVIRRAATTIQGSARQMAFAIAELLDFAEVTAVGYQPLLEPVAVEPMLARVRHRLVADHSLDPNAVLIEVDNQAPFHVQADQGRVEQLLRILLSITILHAANAHVRVLKAHDGRSISFCIADGSANRTPLADQVETHCDGRRPSVRSTSFGLPMAKALATAMSGELMVGDSTPAESEFILTLPVQQGCAARHDASGREPGLRPLEQVLICASDDTERAMLAGVFHDMGIEPVLASDLSASPERSASCAPVLVIVTDALAAVHDRALANLLSKANQQRPACILIGDDAPNAVSDSRQDRFYDAILSKPIAVEDLIECATDFLKRFSPVRLVSPSEAGHHE